jgi:hypothetical protein
MACKEQSSSAEKQSIGFDMAGGSEKTALY